MENKNKDDTQDCMLDYDRLHRKHWAVKEFAHEHS